MEERGDIILEKKKTGPYDDIINMPHHVSKKHPRMPVSKRAAQFQPFSALSGYEEAIHEVNRVTDRKIELDELQKEAIDQVLQKIVYMLKLSNVKPHISVKYFVPDLSKDGGEYDFVIGQVKKVNAYQHELIMESGEIIPIDEILQLELHDYNTDDFA